MTAITTVIWVHDVGIAQRMVLPSDANKTALVLSIPRLPACFLMLPTAQHYHQLSKGLCQEQLIHLARRWGIPLSQCWLEETHHVSRRALSKQLGQSVDVIEMGKAPMADSVPIKQTLARFWLNVQQQLKAMLTRTFLWNTGYRVPMTLKPTWRKSHPSLSVLKKNTGYLRFE